MPAKMRPIVTLDQFLEHYGNKIERQGDCLIWIGGRTGTGYGSVRIGASIKPVHRVVYAFTHGPLPPDVEVDHICQRRECLEITHLRAATHTENGRYRATLPSNNTSGARGVSWHKSNRMWEAHVTVHNKKRFLGFYRSIAEAKAAAVAGRERYFGEFAGAA